MANIEAIYWREQNRKSQKIGVASTSIIGGLALLGMCIQSYKLEQFKKSISLKPEPPHTIYKLNQDYICEPNAALLPATRGLFNCIVERDSLK